MESLKQWAETHPDEKVRYPYPILFDQNSQRLFLRLSSFLNGLSACNWSPTTSLRIRLLMSSTSSLCVYQTANTDVSCRYQGGMSRPMREKAVRAFMSKDKATVMLMSLKCGGVGLNLTRANRVINLDLGMYMGCSRITSLVKLDPLLKVGVSRSSNKHTTAFTVLVCKYF